MIPNEPAKEKKTKDCCFRNFKVCYRPQPEDGYDYVLCAACLLSRIEKSIFKSSNHTEGVKDYDYTGTRTRNIIGTSKKA